MMRRRAKDRMTDSREDAVARRQREG